MLMIRRTKNLYYKNTFPCSFKRMDW